MTEPHMAELLSRLREKIVGSKLKPAPESSPVEKKITRRDFLKRGGLAVLGVLGLGASCAPLIQKTVSAMRPSEPPPPSSPVPPTDTPAPPTKVPEQAPTKTPERIFPQARITADYLLSQGQNIADRVGKIQSTQIAPGSRPTATPAPAAASYTEKDFPVSLQTTAVETSPPSCRFDQCFGRWLGEKGDIRELDYSDPAQVLKFAAAGPVWIGRENQAVVSWKDGNGKEIGFGLGPDSNQLGFYTEIPTNTQEIIINSTSGSPSRMIIHPGARIILVGREEAMANGKKGDLLLAVVDTSSESRAGIYFTLISDEQLGKLDRWFNHGQGIKIEDDKFSFISNGQKITVGVNQISSDVIEKVREQSGAIWAEKYLKQVVGTTVSYESFDKPVIPYPPNASSEFGYLSVVDHTQRGTDSFTGYMVSKKFIADNEELIRTDATGETVYAKALGEGQVIKTIKWDNEKKEWNWKNGETIITLYDAPEKGPIAIDSKTITETLTTDGLNPTITTGKDAKGNLYAYNPDHGWFRMPEKVEMDYMKLDAYPVVNEESFYDGQHNIIRAYFYAMSEKKISKKAYGQYWVSSIGKKLLLSFIPCYNTSNAVKFHLKEFDKTTVNEDLPFVFSGFYKVRLKSGEYVYVIDRTIKIDDATTSGFSHGFDNNNYRILIFDPNFPGITHLDLLIKQMKTLQEDIVILLIPPETLPDGTKISFDLKTGCLLFGPNPTVASLQGPKGEIISQLGEVNQAILFAAIHESLIQGDNKAHDATAPLKENFPLIQLAKRILLSEIGFK